MVSRCPSANGDVKLGHPVPLSNLAPPLNRGRPHNRQVNTPSRFSSRSSPQNGASVPCSSKTLRSSSFRSEASPRSCSSVGGLRSNSVTIVMVSSFIWDPPLGVVDVSELKELRDRSFLRRLVR